jgi:hypothetical protein
MGYDYEVGACAIGSWTLGFLRQAFRFHWPEGYVFCSQGPMSRNLIDIKGYVDISTAKLEDSAAGPKPWGGGGANRRPRLQCGKFGRKVA